MARKKLSRRLLIVFALALVGAGLAFAFWPRASMVDIGVVTNGPMMVTINEEGRTRVREAYVVSTPVAGRLQRVEVHPGDQVENGVSVVALMRPSNPTALDVRTREQAKAAVEGAAATLRVAEADLEAAQADHDFAISDLERNQRLADSQLVSESALERAERAARATAARIHTAEAAIALRKAELQAAHAQLIGFDDRGLMAALEAQLGEEIPIIAPTDGVILRVFLEDETTLAAGAPILEIGDISEGLEVVVELISPDAVKVETGDPVIIDNWGGALPLDGVVVRIEPVGETKVSALGVEEQRVTIVVRLSSPAEDRTGLGHGYRVEARIVIWQADDAVIVPSSALFRNGDGWAVFRVADGRAVLRAVRIGRDNGVGAQVLDGLATGDQVVLYPHFALETGASVAQRVVE